MGILLYNYAILSKTCCASHNSIFALIYLRICRYQKIFTQLLHLWKWTESTDRRIFHFFISSLCLRKTQLFLPGGKHCAVCIIIIWSAKKNSWGNFLSWKLEWTSENYSAPLFRPIDDAAVLIGSNWHEIY